MFTIVYISLNLTLNLMQVANKLCYKLSKLYCKQKPLRTHRQKSLYAEGLCAAGGNRLLGFLTNAGNSLAKRSKGYA